jgi:hypothetical protein
MSLSVELLRDPEDPQHKKMVKALNALKKVCGEDDLLPKSLAEYFEVEYIIEANPDDALECGNHHDDKLCIREWNGDYCSGYEVLVDELPPGTKIIRVALG